jgi:hypothetical protein
MTIDDDFMQKNSGNNFPQVLETPLNQQCIKLCIFYNFW